MATGENEDRTEYNNDMKYAFTDYFNIEELQKIQDLFSEATGVASIITEPDGTPITNPSGFCGLCNEIRNTEKGNVHCKMSDSIIGKTNEKGPNIHRCYSGGLLDAGASILVEGRHIANWLIGQIIDEDQPLEPLHSFAESIGLPEEVFQREMSKVKRMPMAQFESVSKFLYENAQMISRYAKNNLELQRELDQKSLHEIEIEKLNAELEEKSERFRAIFVQSPFGIALVDTDSLKLYQANNKFTEIIGRNIEEMNRIKWTDIIHPLDLDLDMDQWKSFKRGDIATYSINKRFSRPDSSYVWTSLTVSKVEVDRSAGKMHILMLDDITRRKLAEEQLIYYSYHDQLTGLYNRRFYEEEIGKLDKKEKLPLSIIVGDVNGFKLFNDAFGHRQGDLLLKRSAEIIRSACRPDDIVILWGGDEFVILLPSTDLEEAAMLAGRIREECFGELVNEVGINISFGWDEKKDPEQNIQEIMKNAEDQMYKNKIVESEGLRGDIIKTVIHTLHEKSPREEKHSQRVSSISQSIGKALQLTELELNKLKAVGLLHDIGKIGIEGSILDKEGSLTQIEFEEIKKHPDIGYRILNASADMKELAEITLSHHERWDGKGYPNGLKGPEIPVLSRIVSIADSYDAMTSDRPYRKALPKEEAIRRIIENSGTQFDEQIAKTFIEDVVPILQ
jgi:PAS domain S-box/diguanylate cyclase (GGDEF) domain